MAQRGFCYLTSTLESSLFWGMLCPRNVFSLIWIHLIQTLHNNFPFFLPFPSYLDLFDNVTSNNHSLVTKHTDNIPITHSLPIDSSATNPDIHPNTTNFDIHVVAAPGRSKRVRKLVRYLQQYHYALASLVAPPSTSSRYPLSCHLSYHHLSNNHKHFSLVISLIFEPKTF